MSGVLGIGLALLCIGAFDARIRPMVTDMAETCVHNAVIRVINNAVSNAIDTRAMTYDDMVTLQKDNNGHITAMTTRSAQMNTLRAQILGEIMEQVASLDRGELSIPLGNLTGFVAISGRGPRLSVRVLSVTVPDAVFRNVFTQAGINQTLHQIVLDVSVPVKLLIPGGTVETAISTQVGVAETIIVGQVPATYLQLGTPP